nr:hypothetical protein [Tanacetum cinerariifolium]
MLVTMGEGSGTPTESHLTPNPEATPSPQHELSSSSLPPAITEPLPTVLPSDNPPLKQYTRRTKIAQSSVLPPVADEPASPLGDDSKGEACHTDSGLVADQDKANITKTSTLPSDSTPRVTFLAADEGSMQHQIHELTNLCTSLQRQHTEMASKIEAQELEITNLKARVKLLEDSEKGAEKGSNDTKEMVNVLTSLDAATVLSSGVAKVPTGSGSIPTAGPPATRVPTGSEVVPTISLIFTTATESIPYTRRKGKEKMVESDTPKKKKLQEQIDVLVARDWNKNGKRYTENDKTDCQIGRRIELISDLVKYQDNYAKVLKFQTQRRKSLSRKQQRDFYMSVLKSQAGWKGRHFKGMTLEEIKEKFDPVSKQFQYFIPMGSKEEGERFKRKGLTLEQESANKVKITEEVPEEKVKKMMKLIPVEEVYVEALQLKHPIIKWEALVKESLSIRPATSDKEMELWVELKRLYELDVEDQLWTHTQNMMHAPVEWKLYDTCGVHHVIFKDQEIFMLLEKDYPLRKGLALVMICYKL